MDTFILYIRVSACYTDRKILHLPLKKITENEKGHFLNRN